MSINKLKLSLLTAGAGLMFLTANVFADATITNSSTDTLSVKLVQKYW